MICLKVLFRVGLLAAATGCDPGVVLYARQRLEPAQPEPSLDCLASALVASKSVIEVAPLGRGYGREGLRALIRDSTAKRDRREVLLLRPVPPDSGVVILAFTWVGRLRHPGTDEERAVTAIARGVLAELRAACAPDAPSQIECVYDDGREAPGCG